MFSNELNQAEEKVGELEDRSFEIIQSEEQKETVMRKVKKPKGFIGYHQKDYYMQMEVLKGAVKDKEAES